jgi:hypothetical protein
MRIQWSIVRTITVSALAAVAVAGCSSSGSHASAHTSPPFTTTYGQDAALLLSHVPGCANVASDPAVLPGSAADAHCTLLGHTVTLVTWKDAASVSPLSSINGPTLWVAKGTGWTAMTSDGAVSDAQKAIATAVAGALGGKVAAGD